MAQFIQCDNCGAVLTTDDLFCGECGAPRRSPAEPSLPVPPPRERPASPPSQAGYPAAPPAPPGEDLPEPPTPPQTAGQGLAGPPSSSDPSTLSPVELSTTPEAGWRVAVVVLVGLGVLACLAGVLAFLLMGSIGGDNTTVQEDWLIAAFCCLLPISGFGVLLAAIGATLWYTRLAALAPLATGHQKQRHSLRSGGGTRDSGTLRDR